MEPQWDYYFREIEGRAYRIDLDLALDVPAVEWPVFFRLTLPLLRPDSEGLSDDQEHDLLSATGDALGAALGSAGVQVGRRTGAGRCDFLFYLRHAAPDLIDLMPALDAYSGCQPETEAQPDPQWKQFQVLLQPSSLEREHMQDRHGWEALRARGETFEAVRLIEYWAYFHSQGQRSAFRAEIEALGYGWVADSNPPEGDDDFGIQFARDDIPVLATLQDATTLLWSLARRHGGRYDGWETEVVGDDHDHHHHHEHDESDS